MFFFFMITKMFDQGPTIFPSCSSRWACSWSWSARTCLAGTPGPPAPDVQHWWRCWLDIFVKILIRIFDIFAKVSVKILIRIFDIFAQVFVKLLIRVFDISAKVFVNMLIRIFDIFAKVFVKILIRIFFCCLWTIQLHSPRNRTSWA